MRIAVAMAAVVLVAVTLSAVGAQQASPQVLFEKALALEEVQGKLTEAIAVYEKIVAESADKALAAQAQLHIGICYQRVDPKKAARAFQQVVTGYKDQQQVVQQARERLSAIQGAQGAAGNGARGTSLRRIWPDAIDWAFSGSPSPDGKLLSYTDWSACSLGVRDLEKGENRILAKCDARKGEYVFRSIFSQDGRQIAYLLQTVEGTGALHLELRIIGVDGTQPRTIPVSRSWSPFPLSWTPDGRQILAESRGTAQGTTRVGLVSLADGSLKELATRQGLAMAQGSVSPDGRHIAFSVPQAADAAGRDILRDGTASRDVFLTAGDGSGQVPLVEHPADDFVVGWDPEGRRVIVASDRTGSTALWVLPVRDGRPDGPLELLVPDVGNLQPLGMSRDGSLFYGVPGGWGTDIFVATLDPETGRVVEPPAKVIGQNEGRNSAPDWSPDGQFLACRSDRRPSGALFQSLLLIRSIRTGEIQELAPKVSAMNTGFVRWAPDGRSVLVMGFDDKAKYGALHSVDAGTAASRLVVSPDRGAANSPDWTPDGRAFFFVRSDDTYRHIVRREMKTGAETEVLRAPAASAISALALSPDGRQIAFTADGAVKVVPAGGGEPRVVATGSGIAWPTWSRDGKYVLFVKPRDRVKDLRDLWRVAVAGGDAQKLDLAAPGMAQLRMHPDGRRIAFSGSAAGAKPEVWVMEDFLSPTKR